jgi:hypothetical protein
MSIGEARQHFGPVHLYWHGSDHCWDASPGRRRDATRAEHHAREQKRAGSERAKWRDARSELVADNAPAQAHQDTADQPVAAPDPPPIRMMPVRRASFFGDWSERWVDVEQVVAAAPIKANSPPIAAPASELSADLRLVVRGLALFMFGFGLVLTFVTLMMRSNTNPTGPPSTNGASRPISEFVTRHADEDSYSLQIDRDDLGATLQRSTTAPALVTFGGRWLGTISSFVVLLVSSQAKLMCLRALQWARHIGDFISDGAYPMEVKWPSCSEGAMISREDVSRPFTIPSSLLKETRQAAARTGSPGTPPTPRTRPS